MAVITVSREFGCNGTYVAQQVARALNYHFVDKSVIKVIFRQYNYQDFEEVYEAAPDFLARFSDRRDQILTMLNEVIRALARHGNMVILGRGSFAVLADLAEVVHVRIKAPLVARVRRTMEHHGISDPVKAEALVKERDKARGGFVEYSYGIPWDAVRAFDLVVDTETFSPELAVKWIIEGHEGLVAASRASCGLQSTSTLEVDPVLAGTVSQVLECNVIH